MKKQTNQNQSDEIIEKEVKGKKRRNGNRRISVLQLSIIVSVFCLLAVYTAGICLYRNRFLNGTIIDRVDVSGMTISELENQIRKYSLRVIERQSDGTSLEEEISGKEIGISYISIQPLQEILQNQNRFLWFLPQEKVYETGALPFYDETVLEEKIRNLRGFQDEFIQDPKNAYIADYIPGSGFALVAEIRGNRLNRNKTIEVIKASVNGMDTQVSLEDAGCYAEPAITSEDTKLQDTYARLQNYVNVVITYTFGTKKEVLDGDTIAGWLSLDGDRVLFDHTMAEEYVASLRKKYDTVFHKRNFKTSYGAEVTIDRGDYGWWMDTAQETEELIGMLERGESGERVPVYRQTAASYDMPDYGDTYVEINLTAQHLFLYQNGVCILESDFVSGNPSRGNDTPTGIYGITYKEQNATLKGENYSTPVSFWMPFNNNVGMHDATWRSEFGGNIYRTNGSHGCINLPYSIAEQIYNYVEKNTPVICYHLPGTEPEPWIEEPINPDADSPEGDQVVPETEQPTVPETEQPVVPETEQPVNPDAEQPEG